MTTYPQVSDGDIATADWANTHQHAWIVVNFPIRNSWTDIYDNICYNGGNVTQDNYNIILDTSTAGGEAGIFSRRNGFSLQGYGTIILELNAKFVTSGTFTVGGGDTVVGLSRTGWKIGYDSPSDYIELKYHSDTVSTYWRLETIKNGTINVGATISTDENYHIWKFEITPNSVKLYKDGSSVGESTNYIPNDKVLYFHGSSVTGLGSSGAQLRTYIKWYKVYLFE